MKPRVSTRIWVFHSPDGLLHFTCCLLAAVALADADAGAGVDRLGVMLTGVGGTVDILRDLDFEWCLNFDKVQYDTLDPQSLFYTHHTAEKFESIQKKWYACKYTFRSIQNLWHEAYQLFFPKHTKFCVLNACKYTLL